jgi:cytochrome P450
VSAVASQQVLRPGPSGPSRWISRAILTALPSVFGFARRVWPIPHFGSTYAVTLHDDVRGVFAADADFGVLYDPNLQVITGGEPFMLGMADTPAYHAQIAAMRRVVREEDLPDLGAAAEARADAIVAAAAGRVEVVDQLVRRVTFEVIAPYFGVPEPEGGRLDVWATRLFEFQFASSPKDVDLRREVDEIAPAFRAHIDHEIARRKFAAGDATGEDDVLGRCLALQAAGEPGYSDAEIRTAMLCMVVGGPPQPPMVVPQAIEQLLRRPKALAEAQAAARADDDEALRRIVREAMRFDPLAPALPRIALRDATVARGTKRERRIPKGATVYLAFSSAMMDDRRLPEPDRFDANRRKHEYIHFGHGLHECFGRHINGATLHRMLKPLLRRPKLRRAAGRGGRLTKNGPFAERLVVEFG